MTTDKDKYIQAWNSHIDELSVLGNPLIVSDANKENYGKLKKLQQELKELVKIAADTDFK